jgi:serine/threonine protein kinase/Flp pilus assembly protein TadD
MPAGEQEIFCAALEREGDAERAAFLDGACADSPETRTRIEALLRAAVEAGGFLDSAHAPVREATGERIGRYLLRDKIGEGGFGVVYRAEQDEPVRRTVALKIIKLGMDTRAVVARFEAERQALALMDHPNIARVYDAGATEAGRPFFVMELVPGAPITVFCREQQLSVRARLELFQQVCRAVHHAHQKGVIHRDLKPTNILVALEGDQPVAKVIDFGIAKATHEPLTDKTLVTRLHGLMGTPAYMSPEQVGFGGLDVDTRSDIYSLGALLYELLSDAPVLETEQLLAHGYAEVQRVIQHVEPQAPSARVAGLDAATRARIAAERRTTSARLLARLRGDLDRIVLKCLEKDRTRRYETTEDLARDIVRLLNDEPVLARPATPGYRATKFLRRHRQGVMAGAAVALALAGFGVYHARRLASERDRAQQSAQRAAKVSELLTELLTATDPFRSPNSRTGAPAGLFEAIASRVRREFPDQPGVRAEILNAIGRVHLRRGEHEKARPILTEALEAGREIGRPDPRLAQTLSDLGVLCRERDDAAGADAYLREALAVRRRLFPQGHNDVAISLVELGRLQQTREQLDAAEAAFREALDMRRRVLGEVHREVATSLGDLATVLWLKGDLAAAEPLFLRSAELHRETVTAEHPNYAQGLANLAACKLDRGDLAGAEALLREAVAIARRTLSESHWRTARMIGALAGVWRRQGRLEPAGAALDEALAVARTAVGPEHAIVADLMVERARVHLDCGDATSAEPLLREALRMQQRTYIAGSWRVATTQSLLGAALMALERSAEAESLLREASLVLSDIPDTAERRPPSTLRRPRR